VQQPLETATRIGHFLLIERVSRYELQGITRFVSSTAVRVWEHRLDGPPLRNLL